MEEYENNKEQYAMCGAYGTKDAEVSNLYHVTFEAPPAWLMPGNEAVIAVSDIFTEIDPQETKDLTYWSYEIPEMGKPPFTIHNIDYAFQITTTEGTLASNTYRRYHSVVLDGQYYDFVLDSVEYGHYSTNLTFYIDYPQGTAPADNDEKLDIESRLEPHWIDAADSIVIKVDGTEYKFTPESQGSVNWKYNGTSNKIKRAYIYAELPVIDYYEADSIILEFGDQSFDLKESEL